MVARATKIKIIYGDKVSLLLPFNWSNKHGFRVVDLIIYAFVVSLMDS